MPMSPPCRAQPRWSLFMKIGVSFLLFAGHAAIAEEPTRAEEKVTLAWLLNPDGTVNMNTGFSGPVDIAGWRMTLGEDGAPRFLPEGFTDQSPVMAESGGEA